MQIAKETRELILEFINTPCLNDRDYMIQLLKLIDKLEDVIWGSDAD